MNVYVKTTVRLLRNVYSIKIKRYTGPGKGIGYMDLWIIISENIISIMDKGLRLCLRQTKLQKVTKLSKIINHETNLNSTSNYSNMCN